MRLTIHQGSNQIGGNCIEIETDNSRLLFDFGIPLCAIDTENLSLNDYKLAINGLYDDEQSQFDAIFLTHAHPDHYGLLELVNNSIPIYTKEKTYQILKNIVPITTKFKTDKLNLKIINEVVNIGNTTVKAHNVDHSITGGCAFEICSNDKTLLYTGDLRFHGRRAFDSFSLTQNIKNIDYLIMEGTTLNRPNSKIIKEDDLVEKFVDVFKEDKLSLVLFSPQNLDRFITVFKACLKAKKTLVIDPYTCYILELFQNKNGTIPQYNSNNIKAYFAKGKITESLAKNNRLYKYAESGSKISFNKIAKYPQRYVIKGNASINKHIFKQIDMDNLNIIFSMWSGYLEKPSVLDNYKDNIKCIHTSGHAYVNDLQKFVENIKPKYIIPIHTEAQNLYEELFKTPIKLLKDNETLML